jgi:phosphatidate cytidylyltransferase
MAFNLQTFKTRALTAIVFAVVMLVGLLLNGWSFLMLFVIIHFGCWYEFVKLMKKISPGKYGYYLPFGLVYITLPVLIMLSLGLYNAERIKYYDFSFWEKIYNVHYSPILPCGIIFSIWINDTMAYIVGSFVGKTPFSKISPKKTWEGTAGGTVLCVIVISWIGYLLKYCTVVDWIFISSICAICGTLGDLLESKLKRMAGVKDSGTLMPGHGGFLDRFDSFLIATPFVWLYVSFYQH